MNALTIAKQTASTQWHRIDAAYRAATASLRVLPNFLIIGASKSGTTSLYDDLVQHPSVLEAAVKEVHFFDVRFARGLQWYRAQFPLEWSMQRLSAKGDRARTGEASPYYIIHPHAAPRIKQTLPVVKLIALLRNPIDRAYSQYQHEFRKGRESLSFQDAIDREPLRLAGELERMRHDERYHSREYRRHSYLTRGVYADQLPIWLRLFDREQLLILKSEDYFKAPDVALSRVLRFLELSPWEPKRFARRNVGDYAPIEPALRQRLREYFAPHNARLYDLVGANFRWN